MSMLLVSCGSTRIYCPDPQTDIYMDGSYLGKGETTISSMGLPNTAELEAKKFGKVVGKTQMKRQFTWGTLIIGIFTYYTGFLWAWYYPDDVEIPLLQIVNPDGSVTSPWDKPPQNKWEKPVNNPK